MMSGCVMRNTTKRGWFCLRRTRTAAVGSSPRRCRAPKTYSKQKVRRHNGLLNNCRRISLEPQCLLLETTSASSASRGRNRTKNARNRTCLFFPTGAMVAAVLKLYFIGTALTVLAVLYGMVDSFGGLMYVQDHRYILELDHQTQGQFSSGNHQRGPSVKTKHIGS